MSTFKNLPPGNLPEDVELVGPSPHPHDDRKPGGARRKARRRAVALLFEAEARDVDPVPLVGERIDAAAADRTLAPLNPYTAQVVAGVAENLDRLDETITSHLRGWTLARLPAVDRAILRVGVWELLHTHDIPPLVAVNEAVELTKELSADDSPGYVNGLLDAVAALAPQVRAAAAALSADPAVELTPPSPDEPPVEAPPSR